MSIEALSSILKAPLSPVENVGDWEMIESEIRTPLPSDYKGFVTSYGTGKIDNFLWILNPFAKNIHLNLLKKMPVILEAYNTIKRQFPDDHPYSFFPEVGGLLPFGITDNGDSLFWHTIGSPDNWSTVVSPAREAIYEEFSDEMTELLRKLLTGALVSDILPNDLQPVFAFKAAYLGR